MQIDVHKTLYLFCIKKKMAQVTATVKKISIVSRNNQVYCDNLQNRQSADFPSRVLLFKQALPWSLSSMERLRSAYNNNYQIVHYITRNASVSPHQVTHYFRTFDALFRNYLYGFIRQCGSSSNCLSNHFKGLMLSTNLHSSPITLLSCTRWPNVVVACALSWFLFFFSILYA